VAVNLTYYGTLDEADSYFAKRLHEVAWTAASALDREFRQASPDVRLAIRQFLFSQPLAARSGNRMWISHSLPNDRCVDLFDHHIFDRELQIADCDRPGSAYLLTWGRRHSQATLDRMAKLLDVDVFVLGHQPQTQGWCKAGENLIEVLVCNTLANHYLTVPTRYRGKLTSGLLGPVTIQIAEKESCGQSAIKNQAREVK